MEDDISQDSQVQVVGGETFSEEIDALAGYPIMMLFRRLLGNENKQNTVLTNYQIKDILEKEFKMKTNELHELETDIYLSIMKKFLKDWPQWDEFDSDINQMKLKNSQEETNRMLLQKYHNLKGYLSNMLDVARPLAKEKVEEAKIKLRKTPEERDGLSEDLSNVILEVECTRAQLNTLFFKHPHPEQNYSIFNTSDANPSKISVVTPDEEAVLNWLNVTIVFKLDNINFARSTISELKHILVNKKLKQRFKATKLYSGYQEKPYLRQVPCSTFKAQNFVDVLRLIYKNYNKNKKETEYKAVLEVIYKIIEEDLNGLPSELQATTSYRKFFSRYVYVRRLCTPVPEAENDREANNYDLYLREEVTPMYLYEITKVEPIFNHTPVKNMNLKGIHLKCRSCSLKFSGVTMLEQLKQHILENHMNEPDWQCAKCKTSYTVVHLARNRWRHECGS